MLVAPDVIRVDSELLDTGLGDPAFKSTSGFELLDMFLYIGVFAFSVFVIELPERGRLVFAFEVARRPAFFGTALEGFFNDILVRIDFDTALDDFPFETLVRLDLGIFEESFGVWDFDSLPRGDALDDLVFAILAFEPLRDPFARANLDVLRSLDFAVLPSALGVPLLAVPTMLLLFCLTTGVLDAGPFAAAAFSLAAFASAFFLK